MKNKQKMLSPDDFPFIVIEYFKTGLSERPSDTVLRISKNSTPNLSKLFNHPKDCFHPKIISLQPNDNRVYTKRWKYIEAIAVVPQSQTQIYFSTSLDHPHYSVHPMEYQSYKEHVRDYQNANNGEPKLHYCDPGVNHESIFGKLHVTNVFSKKLYDLLHTFPISDLASMVEEHQGYDPKRGSVYLDTGLSSGQNLKRKIEWFGLSGPNLLRGTHEPIIKQVRNKLYGILKLALPSQWKGRLYCDPIKSSYFDSDVGSETRQGVHIHSYRASLGRKYYQLGIHRDSQNDNNNELFAPVLVLSWIIPRKGVWFRLALITYSRKCVSEAMNRINRYGPAIQHLAEHYNGWKLKGLTEINTSIFRCNYKKEGIGQLEAARISPHIDPCVHWSAMGADAILKIKRVYNITLEQGLALLHSLCACNSPDYFRVITNRLLQDRELGEHYFQRMPVEIAIDVYEMIIEFKMEESRNKQFLPGQRHDPVNIKLATREVIQLSFHNLMQACASVSKVQLTDDKSLSRKLNIRNSYLQTIKCLCKTVNNGGLHGSSPSMVNKVVQIGALVGMFPLHFLLQSTIHNCTKTYHYLEKRFLLDDPDKDPQFLLDGLAYFAETNQRVAEGICSKAADEWRMEHNGRRVITVDTLYPDMSILCLNVNEDGILLIREVSRELERIVPPTELFWNSGNSGKVTAWSGYWMATMTRTPGCRINNVLEEKGTTMACPQSESCSKKRKSLEITKKVDLPHHTFTNFNYPSQSDILISSLTCRYPFNMWGLLGMALGKSGQPAGKSDVQLETVTRRNETRYMEYYVPSIKIGDNGSCYHPPIPPTHWINSQYSILPDGRVSFPNADIARRYTVITFLMEEFKDIMENYFKRSLCKRKIEYQPQRLKVGPRRRDPEKLVIFFDNDRRRSCKESMIAVCIQVNKTEGAFALVDDFGRIIQKSTHRFLLH